MEILLIDDDIQSLKSIEGFLNDPLGYNVTAVDSCKEGYERFVHGNYNIVLSDIKMPGMTGIELLGKIKKHPKGCECDVVLMTGFGEIETCIEALRLGAADYLLKPIYVSSLGHVLERLEKIRALRLENTDLKENIKEKISQSTHVIRSELERYKNIVGGMADNGNIGIFSGKMKEIVELCLKFHSERDIPVLIEGETGTGKEVLAQLIHNGKNRCKGPFVAVNCPAIAKTLFESELFGYEKGAFTGANKEGAIGKLELARGGTLFLDEIGDMPLDMQPKLLRVLQEKEMYRIGGAGKVKLDSRFIFATNRSIKEMAKNKHFREDLYYRINTGYIRIPPLRERKQEIAPLALMFLRKASSLRKKNFDAISRDAIQLMESYSWPGNVRELKNTIERIVLLYDDKILLAEHLSFLFAGKLPDEHTNQLCISLSKEQYLLKDIEYYIARKVLDKFDGNINKSAKYLNVAWATFVKLARLRDK